MYTIKSESSEGIYYLSSAWKKNKALWVKKRNLQERMLFKSITGAKTSLKRLLETMDEYARDRFTLVEVVDNNINDLGFLAVSIKRQQCDTIVTIN